MSDAPPGPLHSRLLSDHEDLAVLLKALIAAYETNDREIAANAYEEVEGRLTEHFAVEERLFSEFAQIDPQETNALRAEHDVLRARLFELGVGVDLHQTRIGAIRELVQMLHDHAAREDHLLYRWADRAFSDAVHRSALEDLLHHGRSPAAPVQ